MVKTMERRTVKLNTGEDRPLRRKPTGQANGLTPSLPTHTLQRTLNHDCKTYWMERWCLECLGGLRKGPSNVEKTGGVIGLRVEKRSNMGPSADDDISSKYEGRDSEEKAKESRFPAAAAAAANNNRQSWIDIDGDTSLESLEEGELDDLYQILDRFEDCDNRHQSSSNEQALERSHSFKADKLAKEKRNYSDNDDDDSFLLLHCLRSLR